MVSEQWPESRWEGGPVADGGGAYPSRPRGRVCLEQPGATRGDYELDWLDRAVRAAERHHIAVVIGTPSATPPAWLTEKYPETLRTMADGRKDAMATASSSTGPIPSIGSCGPDAGKLAERFGHDSDVIGWQIDNEYANESYGAETRAQFQQWLRAKYKTLENLNARWTTAYWSEAYRIGADTIQEDSGNPGLR